LANNRFRGEKNSWASRANHTDRITGLLTENPSQLDHLSVVVELFGEVNHLVGRILLFARSCAGQKGGE